MTAPTKARPKRPTFSAFTTLNRSETRSVASWLTERIEEMEPDADSIDEEDPFLMTGLRVLLASLVARGKASQ